MANPLGRLKLQRSALVSFVAISEARRKPRFSRYEPRAAATGFRNAGQQPLPRAAVATLTARTTAALRAVANVQSGGRSSSLLRNFQRRGAVRRIPKVFELSQITVLSPPVRDQRKRQPGGKIGHVATLLVISGTKTYASRTRR